MNQLGGYLLLILLAILAPTPIPIPLDWIIIGLVIAGFNPAMVLIIAGIGDVIGTVLIYRVGLFGGQRIEEYEKRKKRQEYFLAEKLFKKYGKYALVFSGVPFLGDALIFLAGIFKIKFGIFIFWLILGKIFWYLLLALLIYFGFSKLFLLPGSSSLKLF